MGDIGFISLECLAIRLALPQAYLRTLISYGRIPYLRVGRWLRFDEEQVRRALWKIAAEQTKDHDHA